ncbi:relaxase/mobilization nuclease domain-containing protein [Streptomyces sp. NRRL F-5630]|uniref:relaxase/mobilization nuclease domain-containing protein n=1 Tax=Streptomyces sp. NRRL F-5630 TaxID=1463864 RepID=UPI000A518AD0|nr:hypothetical protein [Streptomyces sp. NRRL F-5630]
MNPNITRGSRIYGLLAYLYGPGRHNEHTDPHLVGSWDGFAPDPGRDPNASLKHLANTLDLRPSQLGDALHKRHVWHCSIRTAPEDRELTDQEWDMIARRVLHAVDVSLEGDDDGCRWVAVRHAPDHIHIAATLVRGDLRKVYPRNDYLKAQAACRELEAELGLRRLNPGDRTAAKRASTGERLKAERLNLPDSPATPSAPPYAKPSPQPAPKRTSSPTSPAPASLSGTRRDPAATSSDTPSPSPTTTPPSGTRAAPSPPTSPCPRSAGPSRTPPPR